MHNQISNDFSPCKVVLKLSKIWQMTCLCISCVPKLAFKCVWRSPLSNNQLFPVTQIPAPLYYLLLCPIKPMLTFQPAWKQTLSRLSWINLELIFETHAFSIVCLFLCDKCLHIRLKYLYNEWNKWKGDVRTLA